MAVLPIGAVVDANPVIAFGDRRVRATPADDMRPACPVETSRSSTPSLSRSLR